ncbi:MAG: phosphatidate cytidylyltransferase [Chloroherpetonaceae bacterium]|nr:phosphatidate cytidylyltransferase [Chloroherpetonaceae bacterium]MDW8436783.1 phosphatidate cytidylyltransferase [Chloroherpetonaceae bacterium]
MFGLPPLYNNLLAALLTIGYVFSLVALMEVFVTRFGLARDLSRKITHIGAGMIIAFLPLFDDSHWSRYLNVSIFVIWIFLLVQKGFFADVNDEAVKTMTRTGDRRELLKGPLYFVIVATICGTLFYKTFEGVVAMAILGWGDGMAPIIGSRFGRLKYKILSPKSVEGSLTMFASGFFASLLLARFIVPHAYDVNRILILSLVATAVEGLSPKEIDNFTIPIAVIGGAQFV